MGNVIIRLSAHDFPCNFNRNYRTVFELQQAVCRKLPILPTLLAFDAPVEGDCLNFAQIFGNR